MGKKREERVALGDYRKELTVPEELNDPGFMLRWINDEGGRIDASIKGGYEYVLNKNDIHIGEGIETGNSDLGSRISKVVDKTPRMGEPRRAYLMRIKREWYEEDQNKKLAHVEGIDAQIKNGDLGKEKQEGFYGGAQYAT